MAGPTGTLTVPASPALICIYQFGLPLVGAVIAPIEC